MKNKYAYLILGFLVSFNPLYAYGYWGCGSDIEATGLSEESAANVCDAKNDLTESEWREFYNFLKQNKDYPAKQKIVVDSVVKNNIYAVDDIIRLASQNSEHTIDCALHLILTNPAPRFKDTPSAIAIRDQLRLDSINHKADIVNTCNEYFPDPRIETHQIQ